MMLASCLQDAAIAFAHLLIHYIMLSLRVQKAAAAEMCAADPHLQMHPAAFEHKMSGSFYGNLKRKDKNKERAVAKREAQAAARTKTKTPKATVTRKKRPRAASNDGDLVLSDEASGDEATAPTPTGDTDENERDSEDAQPQETAAYEEGALSP